jgi:prepilin-type N-terminal cleavage/methylation domain-containing protein
MRKNKNGFTLIELLAVIVVLAIIMVIATMQINKTLLKSRTNAFIQSAEQVVKVAKNLQVSSELNTYNLRKAVDYSSSEYQIYVYEYNPAYECHAYTYNASAADKLNEINKDKLKSSYKDPDEFMKQFHYPSEDYKTYKLQKKFNEETHEYELDESEMKNGKNYYECIGRYNYIASDNKDYTTTSAMIMIEADTKGKFNNVNFNINGLNIKNNYNYDIFEMNKGGKRIRICAKLNGDGKVELADSSNGNINKNKTTLCYSASTKDKGKYTVIKP